LLGRVRRRFFLELVLSRFLTGLRFGRRHFGETKVAYLGGAIVGEEDVFRLEVEMSTKSASVTRSETEKAY
jgi:hypothetical protein